MPVTMEQVKELRASTGAGIVDCKKALEETDGDLEAAVEVLRKKNLASSEKKAGRETANGAIGSYVHNGQYAALVEVACETDFVAKNDVFQGYLRDLCMHVCASDPSPIAVHREEFPEDVIEKEKGIIAEMDDVKGKPDKIKPKVIEGKINKWLKERCLMEQPWFKEPDRTVEEIHKDMIGSVGENLKIKRFTRWSLGES